MAAEKSSTSTGAGGDLRISSGATHLCVVHEIESRPGYCVWMDDFVLMNRPQRCLIESILWILHSEGNWCAMSGFFHAYQAGRFKQVLFAGLYIDIYGTP